MGPERATANADGRRSARISVYCSGAAGQSCGADFQVCCFAGFQTRRHPAARASFELWTVSRLGSRRYSRFGNLRYTTAASLQKSKLRPTGLRDTRHRNESAMVRFRPPHEVAPVALRPVGWPPSAASGGPVRGSAGSGFFVAPLERGADGSQRDPFHRMGSRSGGVECVFPARRFGTLPRTVSHGLNGAALLRRPRRQTARSALPSTTTLHPVQHIADASSLSHFRDDCAATSLAIGRASWSAPVARRRRLSCSRCRPVRRRDRPRRPRRTTSR